MKWRMRMGLKTLINAAAPMSIVSPLRRDCGHRPNASQLALSASSSPWSINKIASPATSSRVEQT